ncbi:hypothetical protein FKM82_028445 [Ascaphus truei]
MVIHQLLVPGPKPAISDADGNDGVGPRRLVRLDQLRPGRRLGGQQRRQPPARRRVQQTAPAQRHRVQAGRAHPVRPPQRQQGRADPHLPAAGRRIWDAALPAEAAQEEADHAVARLRERRRRQPVPHRGQQHDPQKHARQIPALLPVTVLELLVQTRRPGAGEPVADVHPRVQPEGGGDHPPAPGQDPTAAEELGVHHSQPKVYGRERSSHTRYVRLKTAREVGVGTCRPLPATPHLEEDLKEVLRSESGIELIILDEPRPDRLKRKPGHQRSPIKKVRKSLALDIVDKGPKPPVLPPPPAGTSMQTQPQSGESFLSSSLNESSCSGREENSLLNQGFVQVQTGKEPLVTPEDLSQAPTDIGALVRTQERVTQHAGIDTRLQNKAGALVKTDTCPFVTVDTGALHKTSLNAGMGPAVKADGDAGCKTEIAAPAGATKPRTPALMTSAWKTVAFGGSRDQLLMQEKARAFLTKPKHSSASRTLILS